MRRLLAFAAIAALCSCVTGRTPPKLTDLVTVAGGQFLFGAGDVPCYAATVTTPPTCQQASEAVQRPRTYPPVMLDLKTFAIEQHEVTNEQYGYCVAVGKCTEPIATVFPNTGIVGDYFYDAQWQSYPVMAVTYEDAQAYCSFIGRRLPYEWEWERIAAGPATTLAQKRSYPIDNGTVNIADCQQHPVQMGYCLDIPATAQAPAPVMSVQDDQVSEGGQKVWDLAGNVAEWVAGYYDEYATCRTELVRDATCPDCFGCASAYSNCQGNCGGGDGTCVDGCVATRDSCEAACWTCPQCVSDADCFRECASLGDQALPICLEYPQAQAFDPLDGSQDHVYASAPSDSSNPLRLARGGAFNDAAVHTCRALTTDRSRTVAGNLVGALLGVGFRCAADVK